MQVKKCYVETSHTVEGTIMLHRKLCNFISISSSRNHRDSHDDCYQLSHSLAYGRAGVCQKQGGICQKGFAFSPFSMWDCIAVRMLCFNALNKKKSANVKKQIYSLLCSVDV